jgi:hypothetical protein
LPTSTLEKMGRHLINHAMASGHIADRELARPATPGMPGSF